MKNQLIDVELMTLTTVNLIRKYIGFIDILFVWITQWHAFRYNFLEAYQTLAEHETQLVWFRKIFIVISRYTYCNSFNRYLQKDRPGAAENRNKIVDEDVKVNSEPVPAKSAKL